MKICKISRPPLKEVTKKFPQGRFRIISKRLKVMGHGIQTLNINLLRVPNPYLAYTLGILSLLFRFRRIRADVILADNIESGMAAVLVKSIFKVPFIFDFIDDYSLIARYDGRMPRYHTLKYLERTIPKLADLVIAHSPETKKFCLDLGIPDQKLRMIPNGVDTRRFEPGIGNDLTRKKINPKGDRLVLFLGKINKYYKLEVVLKAVPYVLKDFPNTRFVFVGDGDYVDHLRELSHELKIEVAVIFTGFLPDEEIPEIINLSDICVYPLPNDGALAIFEYMACAKPMVLPRGGTKKMGISEEIVPEDCALQVEGSPEGFWF
ncbi:MAG: glycosyltransferase family 1 protein [Candidatus Cloacimonadota bacterium]|nr:MAG: glycosyltransferase family 1 protein [Candidatus Cloacimonadota bacterium]